MSNQHLRIAERRALSGFTLSVFVGTSFGQRRIAVRFRQYNKRKSLGLELSSLARPRAV